MIVQPPKTLQELEEVKDSILSLMANGYCDYNMYLSLQGKLKKINEEINGLKKLTSLKSLVTSFPVAKKLKEVWAKPSVIYYTEDGYVVTADSSIASIPAPTLIELLASIKMLSSEEAVLYLDHEEKVCCYVEEFVGENLVVQYERHREYVADTLVDAVASMYIYHEEIRKI